MKPNTLERKEIPSEFKWDFNHIYNNWEEWQFDFDILKKEVDILKAMKGSLSKSSNNLFLAFSKHDEIEKRSYKVYAYPALQKSTDNRDNSIQAKLQEVMQFFSLMNTATSWMAPEIMTIPKETWKEWIKELLLEHHFRSLKLALSYKRWRGLLMP